MIGIVGGGISGLVLAYELRRLGVGVTVWEAKSVPGGVMRSQLPRGSRPGVGPAESATERSSSGGSSRAWG